MAANHDNGVYANRELGEAATLPMKNLDAWKEWVAKQHALMHIYGAEEWFKHLLEHIEEETVSDKGAVPRVEKHLEVEKVNTAQQMLRVRDLPRMQLHPQPYMHKRVTAKTWILILACVIEDCALECRLHDRELYVDALLQQL
ncbi:hypothetical protein AK88_05673 [Plasmodium fragile]|uniref:Schizont-infected cell agglutination C-terminal domain-containing protein n=1 Tax=Plasmodium fragile TaxID=5857 RepID=A0A0D9QCC8_PLAFR|nr:uncharacterized protein AK88_05673 [Plasmodium fragile]KJP84695.1 hypothetical protein AK88_05673 [Plasmodium fragile]